MKEIKTTFDDVKISDFRRCGNSTRQINSAINHLFSGFKVVVLDHYMNGNNKQSNELLFNRILKRLQNEHNLNITNKVIINRTDLTIELYNQ